MEHPVTDNNRLMDVRGRCVRLPALLYHHVGPRPNGTYPSLTVDPAAFAHQVRWLSQQGYRGIAPSDWLRWCQNGASLPQKPVLITFDDGYSDVAEYALPTLRRYRFRAGVYIVTEQLGGSNQWDVTHGSVVQRLMSREQIRYWANRGIEFGSHSRSHRLLTDLTDQQLLDEVVRSGDDLEKILGFFPKSFAYPYGIYNSAVCQRVSEYYPLAFTCDEGLNYLDTDPCRLRRTMVKPQDFTVDLICRAQLGYSPLERMRAVLKLRTRAKRALVALGIGAAALPSSSDAGIRDRGVKSRERQRR